MKYLKSFAIIVMGSFLVWSCSSDDPLDSDTDDSPNIFFGSFGGLCGYSDSLSIFNNLDTHFDLFVHCTDTDFETTQTITAAEYDALLNSFSMSEFSTLNLNSCARCADGTDTFLHITSPTASHRIVFARGDDIQPVRDLINQLEKIREEHQPE